jgi:hypothetical protein
MEIIFTDDLLPYIRGIFFLGGMVIGFVGRWLICEIIILIHNFRMDKASKKYFDSFEAEIKRHPEEHHCWRNLGLSQANLMGADLSHKFAYLDKD